MSPIIVPTRNDGTAYWTQRTNLDGTDYDLSFEWSTREQRWFLTLFDTSGNLLAGPGKLLANWPLFRYVATRAGMPAGRLWCLTFGASTDPPGFDELAPDARCMLWYFPEGS